MTSVEWGGVHPHVKEGLMEKWSETVEFSLPLSSVRDVGTVTSEGVNGILGSPCETGEGVLP